MKLITFLIAFLYGFFVLILFPLLFNQLNSYFSLPVYSLLFLKAIGVVTIIFGLMIWLHCISLFYFVGKGIPVPTSPPKKLVVKGVYKYSRNPMYVSVLFILLGYFFISGSFLLLLYLVLAVVFFSLFISLYEEPILKKKFGKSYSEYCKRTPRWL